MARGRGKLTPQDKEDMKIFSANLNAILSDRNCKQVELSRATGIPASTLTGYVKGTSLPIPGNVQKIADYFGVLKSTLDPRFLSEDSAIEVSPAPPPATSPIQSIYNELEPPGQRKVITYAEKLRDEQEKRRKAKINEVSEKVVQLYGYDYYDHAASAGTGQYLNDVRVEQIELPIDVDADFVIPIKGDSMEPDYHDGDLVFIQTSVDLNDGVIGVFNYNGEAYIKQLVIDTEQSYLHSLNPDYKDMPITPETDFRIIGEVVDLYREK
ncbi:S24 family peptidase [Streptococcus mitis]|uniref:S24 family peptidase n=1 Tax=Streptococcus mitis TaxID=28037 RepID=UPI001CBE9BDC|nr:S24 family peptidase [Streptococcus mitis]MBZ2107991.1 XRE family transcriptional regulator [Streptococcus mitis]